MTERTHEGGASAPSLSDADRLGLVNIAFAALLRRSPSDEERAALQSRVAREADTSRVLQELLEHPEAHAPRARRLAGLPSSAPADDEPAFGDLSLDRPVAISMLRSAYDAFLERAAGHGEIEHYTRLLEEGAPLANLVAAIAESDEAEACRRRRAVLAQVAGRGRELGFKSGTGGPLPAETILLALEEALGAAPGPEEQRSRNDTALTLALVWNMLGAGSTNAAYGAPREAPEVVAACIRVLYRSLLARKASDEEVASWSAKYAETGLLSTIVQAVEGSEEAERVRRGGFDDLSPGAIVQLAYETVLERGASAAEVDLQRMRLEREGLSVRDLLQELFRSAVHRRREIDEAVPANDPDLAYLFGSHGVIGAAEWLTRRSEVPARPRHDLLGRDSLLRLGPGSGPRISIITSLYRGGKYIEAFLRNITSQTIFLSHCELVIIDAASPEGEEEVIARYRSDFPNIVYRRTEGRIGIYEAWNLAIGLASGSYITNANVDDSRRADSLEIQAAVLDSLPFVDVTYQDVGYYFDEQMTFPAIADYGLVSDLPVVSRYNLTEFNSPHNAPMWRRALHDEIGMFDEDYRSAADYDFWLRARRAGKVFYKVNDPHVGYFVNPRGLSTRADTRGVEEANAITRKLLRTIISPLLVMDEDGFADATGVPRETVLASPDRYAVLQDQLLAVARSARRPGMQEAGR